MDNGIGKSGIIAQVAASVRIVFLTLFTCSLVYPLLILVLGQTLAPESADGSLLRDAHGVIIGSRLIAQRFDRPEYFWPRPSAVDYNASAAGGSNLSPANPELRERTKTLIAKHEASIDDVIPADLLTTSGSGLDPNITLSAARYQASRVAGARGLNVETVDTLLDALAYRPGGALTPQKLVNVLIVNMALDTLGM